MELTTIQKEKIQKIKEGLQEKKKIYEDHKKEAVEMAKGHDGLFAGLAMAQARGTFEPYTIAYDAMLQVMDVFLEN